MPAPEGVEHINDTDVVVVSNNYQNYPSDDDLSQLKFNMNRDQIVEILKNNGCKILASWKRRVVESRKNCKRNIF